MFTVNNFQNTNLRYPDKITLCNINFSYVYLVKLEHLALSPLEQNLLYLPARIYICLIIKCYLIGYDLSLKISMTTSI